MNPVLRAVTVVNGTGSGEFAAGTTVQITANAPPTGQRFSHWSIVPAVTFPSGASLLNEILHFIVPEQAVTATAVFEDIPVTGVSIPGTATRTLTAGQTLQLSATITPSNAANRAVTWTSSNTAVATVSTTGLVRAVDRGTVTITATTECGRAAQTTVRVYRTIFSTRWKATPLNWLLFFLGFGWVWMWF